MDWASVKDFVNEMVDLRVKIHLLDMENKGLREENNSLREELTHVAEKELYKPEEYTKYSKEMRVEALKQRVDVDEIIQTESANIAFTPIVEEKTVVIEEMTDAQKRTEYMRVYMREKRKKEKAEKKKLNL